MVFKRFKIKNTKENVNKLFDIAVESAKETGRISWISFENELKWTTKTIQFSKEGEDPIDSIKNFSTVCTFLISKYFNEHSEEEILNQDPKRILSSILDSIYNGIMEQAGSFRTKDPYYVV